MKTSSKNWLNDEWIATDGMSNVHIMYRYIAIETPINDELKFYYSKLFIIHTIIILILFFPGKDEKYTKWEESSL